MRLCATGGVYRRSVSVKQRLTGGSLIGFFMSLIELDFEVIKFTCISVCQCNAPQLFNIVD